MYFKYEIEITPEYAITNGRIWTPAECGELIRMV